MFWQRHLANTGQSREEAIAMLQKLLGDRWRTASLGRVETAIAEAKKTREGDKP